MSPKAFTTDRPLVLIDARMVGPALHGVARYVTLLARGLAELAAQRSLPYEPVFLSADDFDPRSVLSGFECVPCHSPFLAPGELCEIPAILRKKRAAVYHSTSFSSLAWAPCPWIVTLHDLNHLHYGSALKKLYYRTILRSFARRSAALVTVSRFSRCEIADWLRIPEASVELAYNALDPELATRPAEAEVERFLAHHGLRRGQYFLCLANPKPHKNIRLLVQAYREFRGQIPGGELPPLVLTMNGFEEPGIRSLGSLRGAEARWILAGAKALFSPSLYEGFGLPPVEAAAFGIPVVASRIAPHMEGLESLRPGEVAWVDPWDYHGWVNAFHRAHRNEISMTSEETRAALLSRFTPRALASEMDRIYRRVLGIESI